MSIGIQPGSLTVYLPSPHCSALLYYETRILIINCISYFPSPFAPLVYSPQFAPAMTTDNTPIQIHPLIAGIVCMETIRITRIKQGGNNKRGNKNRQHTFFQDLLPASRLKKI